jgi:hypothetical protein
METKEEKNQKQLDDLISSLKKENEKLKEDFKRMCEANERLRQTNNCLMKDISELNSTFQSEHKLLDSIRGDKNKFECWYEKANEENKHMKEVLSAFGIFYEAYLKTR